MRQTCQNGAKRDKTGQNGTKLGKTGQNGTKRDKTGQNFFPVPVGCLPPGTPLIDGNSIKSRQHVQTPSQQGWLNFL
jgi:hypothetical protein